MGDQKSTDCGTPQNRPRLHIVGIHRDIVDQSVADNIFSWPAKPMKSLNAFMTKGLPAADVTAMNFTRLRNLHEIKAKYGKRASAASQEILIGDLDASPGRGVNVGTIIGCRSGIMFASGDCCGRWGASVLGIVVSLTPAWFWLWCCSDGRWGLCKE